MLVQGWLVLDITASPFWVGAVAGLQGAGLVVFGALGGVIADRVNRRNALLVTQLLRALTLLALGLLIVADQIELWHVLVVALFQGLLMAVTLPAGNTLIYDVVGPHRLLNAMAARLTGFNVTRVIGSILAGTLISTLGMGACYLFVAGVSFAAPMMLLFLRVERSTARTAEPVWRNVAERISYAARTGPLRSLLLLSLLMELFGFSYHIMLPVIARDVLEVGASGLGFLAAAGGMGALVGTITVASLGDFRAKGTMLALSGGGAGLCLLLFALSPWFATSLLLVALVGGTLMAYDATMSALLQLLSPDAMRGRIMGLYGLTFGFTPVGGFFAGIVATALSAPFALGLGGTVVLAYVAGFVRPRGRFQQAAEPVLQRSEE